MHISDTYTYKYTVCVQTVYNDLNLIMRYDNLPLLRGQESFFTTSPAYTYQRRALPRLECNPVDGTSFAHAITLNVTDIDNGSVEIHYIHSAVRRYMCTALPCDYRDTYIEDKMPSVSCTTSNTDILSIVRGATTHNPSYVQDALNFLNRTDVVCDKGTHVSSQSYSPVTQLSYKPYTPQQYRSEVMRADFNMVRFDIDNNDYNHTQYQHTVNVLNIMRENKMQYVHILVVSDCNNVCVTSGMSDERILFDYDVHTKYGTYMRYGMFMCTSALKYKERLRIPAKYIPRFYISKLYRIPTQELYTTVHKLEDTKYSWQQKLPSICAHRKFSNHKYEHVGYSFSILRHSEYGMLARAQHYKYEIGRNNYNYYYAADMQLKERNVFETSDTPYGLISALFFARHPTSFKRMAAMSSVLDRRDMLHTSLDGSLPMQQFLAVLSKQKNKYNTVDKRAVVLINNTRLPEDSDINVQLYADHTYVNIVHNCEHVCFQTQISDAHEFMQANMVQEHGLLCLREILESDKLTYDTKRTFMKHNVKQPKKHHITLNTTYNEEHNTTEFTLTCDTACCVESVVSAYTNKLCDIKCCTSLFKPQKSYITPNSHTLSIAPFIIGMCIAAGISVSVLIIRKGHKIAQRAYEHFGLHMSLHNYHKDSVLNDTSEHEEDNITEI